MLQCVFPFSVYCLLKSRTSIGQQMAKMNDRVRKERLSTSRLNHVFLKIYPYEPLKISEIKKKLALIKHAKKNKNL